MEGLTLLAARPKVGKTWLALDIAIAVTTGGYSLGYVLPPVPPCKSVQSVRVGT